MENISPRKHKHVSPPGVWGLKHFYLWDNWCTDTRKYDNCIHRFSLCAPKMKNGKKLDPDERHFNSFIEHAWSNDNGKVWHDTGPSFDPKNLSSSLWSGSTSFKILDNNKIKFIMAITLSNKQDDGSYLQRIGTSVSDDAVNWTPIDICLEYQNIYGYDFSNADNEGLIWRDPYLWQSPFDQSWHMFFAAKKKRKNSNELLACIGHAICKNDEVFNKWELKPSIEIPTKYGQAELPAIVYYKNYYYLFCCCQSAATSQTSYCIFVSKYLESGWQIIFSSGSNYDDFIYEPNKVNDEDSASISDSNEDDDYNNNEIDNKKEEFNQDDHNKKSNDLFLNKKIYGISVFETYENKVCAVAYYDRLALGDHYLTLTPLICITWNENVIPAIPTIQYNHLLIRHDIDDDIKPKLSTQRSNSSTNSSVS